MSSRITAMTHGRGVIHCNMQKDDSTQMIFDHESALHELKHGKTVKADEAIKRALSAECKAVTVKGRRVMRRSNFDVYARERAQRQLPIGKGKSVMVSNEEYQTAKSMGMV